MNKEKVFELIDGERQYQDLKWGPEGRPESDENYSVAEWLVYIEKHLSFAKDAVYHLSRVNALCNVRKIAALAVACMEFNETLSREQEDQ